METEPKKYKNYIVPYVRRGFSASDSWGANAEKASVGIKVDFKMSKVEEGECEKSTTESFTKHIPLAGPELVKQLRSSAVYQVNPADGTAGKSNDYMPYIEFYEEDLPWRFTPRGKGEQIPPWMMLLALKDDEFSVSVNEQGTKVLTVNSAEEGIYPDADKFYCYAHLQLSVPEDYNGSLTDYIKEYPEQCISRLICHRSLEPDTHYTLFLVPSFEIGRVAGLGDTNYDYANLDFSWTNQTDYKNQFPIYYQTSMLSGKATFLDMAKRLSGISQEQYEDLPTSLKVNIDDVYQYTDKPTEGKTIQVPMALGKKNDSELTQQEQIVTEVVKNLLEKNSVFYENLNNQYNEESDPWIVPPVYGARHSLAVLDKGEGKWSSSQFVDDVNLHLHNRVAAGLGSQVVKTHQEELVHRAWTQVEQVNAVNQLIREMIQMRKINESSSKKIQDRKEGEVNEKYAGMYTDAAKKITLGGRIYDFEPRTLLNEIIAEDSHKDQEDGNPVPYEISQGITTEMLKYMSQPSVWKESSKKWIFNTLTYRLLTSPNNKSLFILNYPHFEFLNEYSWGLLSRTDEAKSQLQIYKVDGDSKSGDLTKFWIRPLVWDDTLLFPYLYDYINAEEDIPLSHFTSWIKHIIEYYKNKYYSKNYDHGMFLPFMYKSSNSKDFGFFMPDFKYKHLLETLNLNKDCKYITLDAEEKVKEKEKNGNTKNQYVPRTVYIFPEKTVREKTVDMYSDTPWDKGKTCHWRLNEKNESIKLCVDFNNPRKGEFGLRFFAKPEKVKIDRHLIRNGKFKRGGSMTLDNSKPVSTACHIDKLIKLQYTLTAKEKSSIKIGSRESQCGLENVVPKDLENLYFYLKMSPL